MRANVLRLFRVGPAVAELPELMCSQQKWAVGLCACARGALTIVVKFANEIHYQYSCDQFSISLGAARIIEKG
jgi:hypothetical protein